MNAFLYFAIVYVHAFHWKSGVGEDQRVLLTGGVVMGGRIVDMLGDIVVEAFSRMIDKDVMHHARVDNDKDLHTLFFYFHDTIVRWSDVFGLQVMFST